MHLTCDLDYQPTVFGQRLCPDPECNTHVFFIKQEEDLVTYPAEHINFDPKGIPKPILRALEEATACHANGCYVAATIMVRKTLEALCHDRSLTKGPLKQRLAELRSRVVLSEELLDGLDDLRLLGNDAAHIESTVYNQVGKDETEVAIDITKEVLKTLYQHEYLVERLKKMKKPTS